MLLVLILTGCSGGGSGGTSATEGTINNGGGNGGVTVIIDTATATESVPIMDSAIIPDGVYRLTYITKTRSQITWDILVSGNLDVELTWQGSGIYKRVISGTGVAYLRGNFVNTTIETIDCSASDTARITLDMVGKVVAINRDIPGCSGLVSSGPAETIFSVSYLGIADKLQIDQRSVFTDGSIVTYHYSTSTAIFNASEANDFVDNYFSGENFSGSILSI